MRVCQPGPVAFQTARTDSGRRMVTWRRGSVATGRPARLTVPRWSMASVSSGSSSYSPDLTLCESTRLRSDFKVRADAGLLAFIGFSHAEDVAACFSRRVANHDKATCQMAEADDARLTVLPAGVFNLEGEAGKDLGCILEIEAALLKRLLPLGRVIADAHYYCNYINVVRQGAGRADPVHERGRAAKPIPAVAELGLSEAAYALSVHRLPADCRRGHPGHRAPGATTILDACYTPSAARSVSSACCCGSAAFHLRR